MDSITAEDNSETINKVLPLLEEGRYGEALPFLELQKSRSTDPVWQYLTALTLACQDRGSEGAALLEKIWQTPGFNKAFGLNEGVTALTQAAALNHLIFETTVDETCIGPWQILAKYADLLNNRDAQIKAASGLLKLDPENPENIQRFSRLYSDDPSDEAIKTLEAIINLKPGSCRPRVLLGTLLQKKGKTALAIRYLKTALESNRSAAEPHAQLGMVYASQARFEEAEKEFLEAISKSKPTASILAEVAGCQQATFRYDESLSTYLQALKLEPLDFTHWDKLASAAHTAGRTPELMAVVRDILTKFPDASSLGLRYASMLFDSGDPLAAQAQLHSLGAFNLDPINQELTSLALEVSNALEQYETALSLAKALYQANSLDPKINIIYGTCLLACGQSEEAESLLRDAARKNPNDKKLQITWGRSLLALGDSERAHRAFSLASRLDPDDAEAMAEQGCAMLSLGLHEEALNVLKESAKKHDPPLATTLNGLGLVYERKKLQDAASDFYAQALKQEPCCTEAACGLIRTQKASGIAELLPRVRALLSEQSSQFARLKLLITIFKAMFMESAGEEVYEFKKQVFPPVLQDSSEEYKSFLHKAELKAIKKLTSSFEASSHPEQARSVWRYVLNIKLEELSEEATSELKRLDSFESLSVNLVEERPKTSSTNSGDDLSSLLSQTLPFTKPQDTGLASSAEVELFADESKLSTSSIASEDVPLFFEDDPLLSQNKTAERQEDDDILSALFAADIPSSDEASTDEALNKNAIEGELKIDEASPSPEDPISLALAAATPQTTPDPNNDSAPMAGHQEVTAAKIEPEVTLVSDLFATDSTPPAPKDPAEITPPTGLDPVSVANKTTAAAPPTSPDPLPTAAEPAAIAPPKEPESVPVADETAAITPSQGPEITAASAYPKEPAVGAAVELETVVATPLTPLKAVSQETSHQDTKEELLPIPMPADFSPLTRRQLHYHEMLVSSNLGIISPESIAHLLLQTGSQNEPPDPGSDDAKGSTSRLQDALLASALELEKAQQFKLACRVLRTALLYQPDESKVVNALARVQLEWSDWLCKHEEFAYAINLLRNTLSRDPNHSQAVEQLKETYQSWMSWSLDKGDPAARDLLAVYLEQENTALAELRQDWEAHQKRLADLRGLEAAKLLSSPPVAPTLNLKKPDSHVPSVAIKAETDPKSHEVKQDDASAPSPEFSSGESVKQAPDLSAKPKEPEVKPSLQPDINGKAKAAQAKAEQVNATQPKQPTLDAKASAEVEQVDPKTAAIQALSASLDDEEAAAEVFSLFSSSMRELTSLFKEKATSFPEQPAWLLLLARAYRQSGSETMAVIQYQKYIKLHPTREAYEELAKTYEELGKEDFAKMTRRKAEKI